MRNRREVLALALGSFLSTTRTWAAAQPLRIGVIATLSPGTPTTFLSFAMRPLRSYLEEKTGMAGEIVRGGNCYEVARALHEGGVQLAIFHGHEFAWAKTKLATLEPIVFCVNPLRSVRAYLVVSPRFRGNLQGEIIALPRDGRDHCRLYFERHCVPAGTDPNTYYRRISRPSDTDAALDEVASDRALVAIVDAVGWERYQRAHAKKAQRLRVAYQSEAFPGGVLGYDSTRLSAADAARIRDALIQAKNHPRGRQSLQVLKLAAFEAPSKEHQASLEAILKHYPAPRG